MLYETFKYQQKCKRSRKISQLSWQTKKNKLNLLWNTSANRNISNVFLTNTRTEYFVRRTGPGPKSDSPTLSRKQRKHRPIFRQLPSHLLAGKIRRDKIPKKKKTTKHFHGPPQRLPLRTAHLVVRNFPRVTFSDMCRATMGAARPNPSSGLIWH